MLIFSTLFKLLTFLPFVIFLFKNTLVNASTVLLLIILFTVNKQMLHAFLINIINYSPEVINIILPRVNDFDIKQRHGIFVLLYATNTKQDLER